jgi:hypothetical protein
MPTYRIRYALWQIDAPSASEAKKEVCDLYRRTPERFVSVEDAGHFNPRRPLWKRLVTGR